MNTVCIVQARLGSTRLPRKVMLPLNGHTVLAEVLFRCHRIPSVDMVLCATPDKEIADEAWRHGFKAHVGSEHDVLGRYYEAAKSVGAKTIVRITADCPLISPDLCDEVIKALVRNKADYASNVHPRSFPKGMDCEAFTFETLEQAHRNAGPDQREHVTTWMLTADIKRANVISPWKLDGRLTLDTWGDYETIKACFDGRVPAPDRGTHPVRVAEGARRNGQHQPQEAAYMGAAPWVC
jgi:spore coat polysaccharide biosynthesis protein SpsF